MDEKEKINDSYLTIEAKTDINRMLGNEGSGGGSSFNTQLETSEGLTLGKGTEDEESLTASELHNLKNHSSEIPTSFLYANGTLGALSIAGHGHVYKEISVLTPALNLLRSLISSNKRPVFSAHSNGTSPEGISLQFDASIDNNFLQSSTAQAPTKMYIRITNPTDSQITFNGEWGTFNVICTMINSI